MVCSGTSVRACVFIYYSAITRQLVLTTLIIREGWQYIECEKLDEKRKLLIYEVFISRHKGPFRIFCNLIGLFGVHFIAGGSMPLSFTLSYNITLIPLP